MYLTSSWSLLTFRHILCLLYVLFKPTNEHNDKYNLIKMCVINNLKICTYYVSYRFMYYITSIPSGLINLQALVVDWLVCFY
jgi:hypothetical protein